MKKIIIALCILVLTITGCNENKRNEPVIWKLSYDTQNRTISDFIDSDIK